MRTEDEQRETFYLTTPIYYPSDKLHIGHSYTTVAADCIARYQRMLGKDVMFLTGMDEHGQKIQKKAEAAGLEPQAYVDKMAVGIKELWQLLNISYDKFIRTTDDYHEHAVQVVFQKLYDQGDIYKGFYEGWYCTSCESFWTEAQLAEGACPDCGGPVNLTKEESYFFRLSKYGDRILELYEKNPNFLKPDRSRKEMINFIKSGLEDLAVTRTSFDWGVKVPFDEAHVIYVWVDALVNYISALGYPEDAKGEFAKYWPADIHLIGKEIVRFHCIIWPAMLMALGIDLPQRVFAHGWLLLNDSKMSKSKGNVVDPVLLCERYGVDAVRYFLLREVAFGSDGNFTNESLVEKINSDLANDLGNLLSRSTAMVNKYFQGVLPEADKRVSTDFDSSLKEVATEAVENTQKFLESMEFSHALEAIWNLVKRGNKYIDETEPWKLAKEDSELPKLANVLGNLLESLRVVGILIKPFMPETSSKILQALGKSTELDYKDAKFQDFRTDTQVKSSQPLFPRLKLDEEMAWLDEHIATANAAKQKAKAKKSEQSAKENSAESGQAEISYEDFSKLELCLARVLECEPVPDTDKLLKFKLQTANGVTRTVVSGLAKYYKAEDLVGKQVVLLANLKPRKIRGILSQGMILSAEAEDGELSILTADKELDDGAVIA